MIKVQSPSKNAPNPPITPFFGYLYFDLPLGFTGT